MIVPSPAVVPPGSPPRSPITQLSSHSSSVCSRDGDTRTSSRARSRSGPVEVGARDAVPLARRGARDARIGEQRELLRRPRRQRAPRRRIGQRAPVLGDEPAQRQRMARRVWRSASGRQLEEDARPGVVVVDGGHHDERGRPATSARTNSRSSSCIAARRRSSAARRLAVGAGRGIRQPPGVEQPAAQARVGPHAVLHAGDHDGVELEAERTRRA